MPIYAQEYDAAYARNTGLEDDDYLADDVVDVDEEREMAGAGLVADVQDESTNTDAPWQQV